MFRLSHAGPCHAMCASGFPSLCICFVTGHCLSLGLVLSVVVFDAYLGSLQLGRGSERSSPQPVAGIRAPWAMPSELRWAPHSSSNEDCRVLSRNASKPGVCASTCREDPAETEAPLGRLHQKLHAVQELAQKNGSTSLGTTGRPHAFGTYTI